MIQRRLYPDLDLILHTVHGPLDEAEFRAAVVALYALDPTPRLSLWDLSEANLDHITLEVTQAVQMDLAGKVKGRTDGRTGVVAPQDFAYASGRQYTAITSSLALPFDQQVFRSRDEAWAWLGIDPEALSAAAFRDLPG